jgi:hypothetical protein
VKSTTSRDYPIRPHPKKQMNKDRFSQKNGLTEPQKETGKKKAPEAWA